jgi:hypothetical protein
MTRSKVWRESLSTQLKEESFLFLGRPMVLIIYPRANDKTKEKKICQNKKQTFKGRVERKSRLDRSLDHVKFYFEK